MPKFGGQVAVFHTIKIVNKGVSECNYACEFIVLLHFNKKLSPYREHENQIQGGKSTPSSPLK